MSSPEDEYDFYNEEDDEDADEFLQEIIENEPQAEFGAYDRVAVGRAVATISHAMKLAQKKHETPTERFINLIGEIGPLLQTKGVISGFDDSFHDITRPIASIEYNVDNLNAIAYILGYYAAIPVKNKDINKTTLTNVINRLPKLKLPDGSIEGGITPTDVLRYARFWKTIYGKNWYDS